MDIAPWEDGQPAEPPVVMASIDRRPEGDFLVIADISRDGRWLAVPLTAGLEIADHR